MAAYDDLNIRRITAVSVISVVVTAVSVLAIQVIYFAMADMVDERKSAQSAYSRQNEILADQAEEVGRYGVNPENGRIVVPVSKVMEEMAEQSAKSSEST